MTDNNIPDLSRFRVGLTAPRIGEELAGWVAAVLGTYPDQISWEIALQLLPTPQGMQPGFALLVRMPSPVLGETLAYLVLLDLGAVQAETTVAHHVRNAVEQLRQQRTALLGSGPAPLNGNGGPG